MIRCSGQNAEKIKIDFAIDFAIEIDFEINFAIESDFVIEIVFAIDIRNLFRNRIVFAFRRF